MFHSSVALGSLLALGLAACGAQVEAPESSASKQTETQPGCGWVNPITGRAEPGRSEDVPSQGVDIALLGRALPYQAFYTSETGALGRTCHPAVDWSLWGPATGSPDVFAPCTGTVVSLDLGDLAETDSGQPNVYQVEGPHLNLKCIAATWPDDQPDDQELSVVVRLAKLNPGSELSVRTEVTRGDKVAAMGPLPVRAAYPHQRMAHASVFLARCSEDNAASCTAESILNPNRAFSFYAPAKTGTADQQQEEQLAGRMVPFSQLGEIVKDEAYDLSELDIPGLTTTQDSETGECSVPYYRSTPFAIAGSAADVTWDCGE